MNHDRKSEIDRNYDFFQRSLSDLVSDYEGMFALIRHKEFVDFFETPGEAYRSALAKYPDELFSIQLVTRDPVELGHMSVALS